MLERASQGVLRKLNCAYSTVEEGVSEKLRELVQKEPCALLELDVAGCKRKSDGERIFQGQSLSDLLVPTWEQEILACRNLRVLRASECGFGGESLESVQQLAGMSHPPDGLMGKKLHFCATFSPRRRSRRWR